jgi:hypothetical protein
MVYAIKIELKAMECQCVNMIELVNDEDQWQALVDRVIIFWVAQNVGDVFSDCQLLKQDSAPCS